MASPGYEISALSIGTMRFKSWENAVEIIKRELKLGLNYFDIAPGYCRESDEEKCPQSLPIIERMQKMADLAEEIAPKEE